MDKLTLKNIVVVKETRDGEGRVALTPSTVVKLSEINFKVMVEKGAGVLAGFSDSDYKQVGADIIDITKDALPSNCITLRVKRADSRYSEREAKLLLNTKLMIGFLDPFDVNNENHIKKWQSQGIQTCSLELLSLTSEDPKNAQAAMSRFAGRLAMLDALKKYQGDRIKNVAIFGTGPAGINAALTARKHNLSVTIFGRRSLYRQSVEKCKIEYLVLPNLNQKEFIKKHISNSNIILTAARIIGENSPLLIDQDCIKSLPDNTVIVDLSTGEGGNVLGSQKDKTILFERGITVTNLSGYPKMNPEEASIDYSDCMLHILMDLITSKSVLKAQINSQQNH